MNVHRQHGGDGWPAPMDTSELYSKAHRQERRRHQRFLAGMLQISRDGRCYPLINISEGGLSLEGTPFALGQMVVLTLSSTTSPDDTILADCKVVAVRQDATHLTFEKVTIPLLTFIMAHIGRVLGVAPYYFRAGFDAPKIARRP